MITTTITQAIPMIEGFMLRAALAGLGLALAAGPLGCFVVWRRMAYFGDATAHAAILGVALSLISGTPVVLGVLLAALAMAFFISWRSASQSVDTALGVAAHSALALGLVAVAMVGGVRIDLAAFLFGDILAVNLVDLALIWGGASLVLALIWSRWAALLTATLNADLAAASGISAKREQLVLTVALAVVVAVAIKIVGALLITAMLIIPAASARPLSRSPESMAILSVVFAALAVLGGLTAAWHLDTPAGPSIVCAAAALFVAAQAGAKLSAK